MMAMMMMMMMMMSMTITYRLYVNRTGGGRSLLRIEMTCKAEIINIAEYLYNI
jgi:hypothetical protein